MSAYAVEFLTELAGPPFQRIAVLLADRAGTSGLTRLRAVTFRREIVFSRHGWGPDFAKRPNGGGIEFGAIYVWSRTSVKAAERRVAMWHTSRCPIG